MYKVIIVDDEDVIVRGLSTLLPWDKYKCEVVGTARDGKEALLLLEKNHPDIIFTDIKMPNMDGLEFIAALRSEYPATQISILSGYPDFKYAQRAIALGVSNYILKPSKMAELEEVLKRMVDALNLRSEKEGYKKTGGKLANNDNSENASGNFIISNVIKYIDENYSKRLTLPLVASEVYVSQWHLSKLIAKYTGQNFSDLLNGARIREAKKLLEDPSLKIREISERVGFSDVTHFSRIFKKMENCSANEYRNKKLVRKGFV